MFAFHVCGLVVVALLLLGPQSVFADTTVITFEGLSDGTILTNQYSGLSFSNGIILTAGISLNEFEFPPYSGFNVVSDNVGPMRIDFTQPIADVGGFFTYGVPLTLRAFDGSNLLLGSVSSPFSSNMALSGVPGSSPNEFLDLPFNGISYVTLTGDPLGSSFALDNLTYTGITPTPEPSSLLLVFFGGLVALYFLRREGRRRAVANSNGLTHRADFATRNAVCQRMRFVQGLKLAVFGLSVAVFAPQAFSQQHTVGGTHVSPTTAIVGQSSIVTVSVSIPDPVVIAASVNLLRLDSAGNATVVGILHDDGQNGDIVAGDGIFTFQATLNESVVGQIHFQVSAAFRGSLRRVRADVSPVFVQVVSAPDAAVAGLSAELASGNITAALLRFLDSDKANAVLKNLSTAGQQRLANAIAAAQLASSSADLRVYHAPLIAPNGHVLSLEFTLGPNSNGDWVIIAW